jgi:hypothetical protein
MTTSLSRCVAYFQADEALSPAPSAELQAREYAEELHDVSQ